MEVSGLAWSVQKSHSDIAMNEADKSVHTEIKDHVAVVEMRRPPHNYFDHAMLRGLADAFERLEEQAQVRAIVLCSQGDVFSAGAQLGDPQSVPRPASAREVNPIYAEAVRLFAVSKPIVAAVQGAAVGGGLGLALVADFRVTCAEARFSANFARLGITPGFGLTATLPRLIGRQMAAMLFYTGQRIGGREAVEIGLADLLVKKDEVRDRAVSLAQEVAVSSPSVVLSVRDRLRDGFVDEVRLAVARESAQQYDQFATADFQEGVAAMKERRAPRFMNC